EEAIAGDPEHPLFTGLGAKWQRYQLVRIVHEILTDIRNRGLAPEEIALLTSAQPTDPGKRVRLRLAQLVAQANALYATKKQADQLVDAVDLLERTALVLELPEAAAVRARIGDRCHYLFIDEFQDTDRVQMRIVDALLPHLAGV